MLIHEKFHEDVLFLWNFFTAPRCTQCAGCSQAACQAIRQAVCQAVCQAVRQATLSILNCISGRGIHKSDFGHVSSPGNRSLRRTTINIISRIILRSNCPSGPGKDSHKHRFTQNSPFELPIRTREGQPQTSFHTEFSVRIAHWSQGRTTGLINHWSFFVSDYVFLPPLFFASEPALTARYKSQRRLHYYYIIDRLVQSAAQITMLTARHRPQRRLQC